MLKKIVCQVLEVEGIVPKKTFLKFQIIQRYKISQISQSFSVFFFISLIHQVLHLYEFNKVSQIPQIVHLSLMCQMSMKYILSCHHFHRSTPKLNNFLHVNSTECINLSSFSLEYFFVTKWKYCLSKPEKFGIIMWICLTSNIHRTNKICAYYLMGYYLPALTILASY